MKWLGPLCGMIERIEIKYAYEFEAFNAYGSGTEKIPYFSHVRAQDAYQNFIYWSCTHADKRTSRTLMHYMKSSSDKSSKRLAFDLVLLFATKSSRATLYESGYIYIYITFIANTQAILILACSMYAYVM